MQKNKRAGRKPHSAKDENIGDSFRPKFSHAIGESAQDPKKALTLYKKGLEERNGREIDRFEWARDAAILGVEDAIQQVILAYQTGLDTEPNARMAFEWLKKAADDDKKWAYYDLAKAYGDGLGTRVDVELFREWMTKATTVDGGRDGMMELAKSYIETRFGTPDPKKAFEWILKMATAGGAGAMTALSQAHAVGARVALDIDEQLNWAKKAVKAAKQDTVDGDYASQDLPFALSALEVAWKAKNKPEQAAEALNKASKAAYEASIFIGKKAGDISLSNDLLKIMLRNQKGREECVSARENFESLSQIQEVAASVYKSKGDCPAEISNAIFELSEAHRTGAGTKKSYRKHIKYIELAKTLRDYRAMYKLALKSKNREDLQAAAAAGSMEAFARFEFEKCRIPEEKIISLVKLIIALRDIVNAHREEHHRLKEDVEVAHYTDGAALENMLGDITSQPKNLMRMYNIAYLNDPGEGTRLFRTGSEDDKNLLYSLWGNSSGVYSADVAAEDHFVYIGSFSAVSDQLNLWRAYTNHGDGFSIVTPSSAFAKNFFVPQMAAAWSSELKPAQHFTLYRVLYKESEAKLAVEALRPTLKTLKKKTDSLKPEQKKAVLRVAGIIASELRYLYKSEEYASENEVRFVTALRLDSEYVRRDKMNPSAKLYAETKLFFFMTPGSKIIIGPTVSQRKSVAMALRQSLCDRGWDGACSVEQTKVEYKKSSSHAT